MSDEKSAKDKLIEEDELMERQYCVDMEDFFGTTDAEYDAFDESAWAKGNGYSCPSFPLFDRHMEGLFLIAGESNSGKSALLTNLIFDYCTNADNNLFGIYFALDDTKNELIPRLISMHESIPISVGAKPQRYQEAVEQGIEGSGIYAEYLEKRQHGLE